MNANEMIALAERLSECYNERGSYTGDSNVTQGGWRSVLVMDQYAFKSVRNKKDRDCQIEWDFYTMTTDNVRDCLSKPFYISRNGCTIVMEKLTVCKSDKGCDYGDFDAGCRVAEIIGSTYGVTISDTKPCNFGEREEDGAVVMLDYGNLMYDVKSSDTGIEAGKQNYNRTEHMVALQQLVRKL